MKHTFCEFRTDLIESGEEDTGSGGFSADGRSLNPFTPTKALVLKLRVSAGSVDDIGYVYLPIHCLSIPSIDNS